MADVAPSGVSMEGNSAGFADRITKPAGGALRAGVPGRVNSSGEIVESLGAALTVAANIHGIIAKAVTSGGATAGLSATLLVPSIQFQYDDTASLTVGNKLYLAATGGFADSASTGDPNGVAVAVSTTDVMLVKTSLVV